MSKEQDRQENRNNGKSSSTHDFLIKLRGIPQATSKDDIKGFLHPSRIDTIHLFNNRGNTSGECLVDLESEADVKDALKKSNQSMGGKYVEIFQATAYEYNFFMKHKGTISWREPVIRMNGLPYTCTMGDVQNFFKDASIARNGIYITRDMTDNALGGGYVAFVSMEHAYKAIDIYDQKRIQHRYIELFPSTYEEAKKTILNDANVNGKQFAGENDEEDNNSSNLDNNQKRNKDTKRSRSTSRDHRYRSVKTRRSRSASSRSRSRQSRGNGRRQSRSRSPVRRPSNRNRLYLVKMRGMPFTVAERDIREFFPSNCQPVRIEILYDRRMKRPNGDAYVYFNTMDQVDEAVKCDRKYMSNRYVEIYFDARHNVPTNRRRSKSNRSSPSSSRSPSKTKNHNHSRSRTVSPDKNDR